MSGIFIHDDNKTIEAKIMKSFCPIGVSENNPILEIIKYIIFHSFNDFTIEHPSNMEGLYHMIIIQTLKDDYRQTKNSFPSNIKQSTSAYLCKLIEPIRNHFKNNEPIL